ncbi:ABC transporter substrate-binding protein [Parafrankia sp. BMG5.11]|uniref:ABC transporter substrate-binding protein n=1 Tax=Parafrankia sp. BMG5.11 TaxID=222540 RepID=UPI00103A3E99|nr:ABC transporter substrate-binding protein [Parafrankia sp. BMG5.11]TCJ34547.1 ABC transporter substrate-binding protein [Parafrankia sp. BMG5.11]
MLNLTSASTSRRALPALAAVLAMVVAGCGTSSAGGGGALDSVSSSVPASADDLDTSIDTSKVKKNLTVGVLNPHYVFHNDILIALEKGYFKEVGIDSVDIKILDDPIPALIGGSLDFINYDTDSIMAAAKQSESGIRFLGVTFGGEFVGLGVREGIESVSDLDGKTISGGEFNSRNDANLRELLRSNGIDPEKDVNIVSTGGGSNERLTAILSGTIDAGNIQIRHREMIENEGGRILLETLRQVPQSGWAAAGILNESPETAAAFLAAVLKGRAYVDDPTHKDEVVDLMNAKDFNMPAEYVAAYEEENAPDYHTLDGGFEVADMDQFIEDSIRFETAPEGTDWKDFTDLLPLWRAQKALGLPLRPSLESVTGN